MMHSAPSPLGPPENNTWEELLRQHDRNVAARAGAIWVGAEPTFTDRFSWLPEWQTAALGEDKKGRARRMVDFLARAKPGSVILRTLGRQYPEESQPRWSFGVYGNRDGTPIWTGPPDPLQQSGAIACSESKCSGIKWTSRTDENRNGPLESESDQPPFPESEQIKASLEPRDWPDILLSLARGWGWEAQRLETGPDGLIRILLAGSESSLAGDWLDDPRARRPLLDSVVGSNIEPSDTLSRDGVFLLIGGRAASDNPDDSQAWQLELPGTSTAKQFRELLALVAQTFQSAGVARLILTGYPPPVDDSVAWTTVTPDPGVLEINMAPAAELSEFYREHELLHEGARWVGLDPLLLLYNGQEADSGGGQHLTFGGSTADSSPFFRHPILLPRLIAFLNQHPCLSYLFAGRSVGSSGQSPRVDEVTAESMDGLSVALDLLAARALGDRDEASESNLAPDELWRCVSPFLTDRFGNTHRSEINVEKLWNPNVGDRGKLGLVELRAFRMLHSPEDTAAVAVLIRSILTMLTECDVPLRLVRWGAELHDRFGLPHYLYQDLREVLKRLAEFGLEIHPWVRNRLLDDSYWQIGSFSFLGLQVELRRGIEFWPLVGDHSIQNATSRQVDSSSARIELRVSSSAASDKQLPTCELGVEGHRLPMNFEVDQEQAVLVGGVRYKAFEPSITLFPLVKVRDPLTFVIRHPGGEMRQFTFHGWKPDGGNYDGLPQDLAEARRRTGQRLVVEPLTAWPELLAPPDSALSKCCLDTRRLSGTNCQDREQRRPYSPSHRQK
jgi:uncharacterized protein (DUF2126 family)